MEFTLLIAPTAEGSHTDAYTQEIVDFMAEKGYTKRATVSSVPPLTFVNDHIFVKNGFKEHIELKDILTPRVVR